MPSNYRASPPILEDHKSPIVTPTDLGSPDVDDPERNDPWPGLSSDPELEGLSIYDKKCLLINREIDAMGMGKYQWYIWGLCGFGYMLDLLWAQAFSLALSPLQQEMGFGNDKSGNISTCFNAGLTAGAFVWGVLSDIVGTFITACALFILRQRTKKRSPNVLTRSQMGFQLDMPIFLHIWAMPRCLQQLHHLPHPYSLCWFWCGRQHSHRHDHHARVPPPEQALSPRHPVHLPAYRCGPLLDHRLRLHPDHVLQPQLLRSQLVTLMQCRWTRPRPSVLWAR